MNLKDYLYIQPEIETAVREGKPVVALTTDSLFCGITWPQNFEFAKKVQKIIEDAGAIPAFTAVLQGILMVGLTLQQLENLCSRKERMRISRKDIPIAVACRETGTTTVASGMILASLAGIRILVTDGIGGVGITAQNRLDISADLQELTRTPVAVVCSGVKLVANSNPTLEYLETMGIPVVGIHSKMFPAFFCQNSGLEVDYSVSHLWEAAQIIKAKWDIGLQGGIVLTSPIADGYAMDFDFICKQIADGLESAQQHQIHGNHLVPYLMEYLSQHTNRETVSANLQILYKNAQLAANLAQEYCHL